LYVSSAEAWLDVEPDNPLLHRWNEVAPWEPPARSQDESVMKRCDRGRLFLTSQRFIWVGKRGRLSFPLNRVKSAHLHTILFFGFLYGLRRYRFGFLEDSLLKWLTYTALAARRVEQNEGHRISTTNY